MLGHCQFVPCSQLSGTLYILLIMACAKLKSYVTDLSSNMLSSLCKLIRYPDDSAAGKLVKRELIPAVAIMRRTYPFSFDVLFPETLAELGYATNPLLATDVAATDRFFDCFLYE